MRQYLELCRRIRSLSLPHYVYILFLTVKSAPQETVAGLEVGADDYLVKPFHLRELLLRVERMLERSSWYAGSRNPAREIEVAGYSVNLEQLSGAGPHGELQLTILEGRLLDVLTSEPNRVLSRGELLEKVWGYNSEVETRTVDNFIVRLRRYFEREPEQPRHFISVRGKGYMYVP